MKKLALAVALSATAATTQAALWDATGSISNWTGNNAIGGGESVYADGDINLAGTIDLGPGFTLLAMDLAQVGTFTSAVNGATDGTQITMTGLTWTLSANAEGPTLTQTGGSASCIGTSVACTAVAAEINIASANSAMNWTGVTATDVIGTPSFAPTFLGPLAGLTFAGVIPGPVTQIDFGLSGYSDGGNLAFNSVNGGDLTLLAIPQPVPVPAAAWLFGSALIGLAGIGRNRKV